MLGISGRMATDVLLTSRRPAGRLPGTVAGLPWYSNVPMRAPVPKQWHDLAMISDGGQR
jgi:hypothetical protein